MAFSFYQNLKKPQVTSSARYTSGLRLTEVFTLIRRSQHLEEDKTDGKALNHNEHSSNCDNLFPCF